MRAKTVRTVSIIQGILLAGSLSINMANAQALWEPNSPFLKGVQTKPNMEPTLPHETWDAEAEKKLEELEKTTGRKPNILIFFVDDMGWGDPGCYGGGAAIGAPTPQMDALAQGGLL